MPELCDVGKYKAYLAAQPPTIITQTASLIQVAESGAPLPGSVITVTMFGSCDKGQFHTCLC